VTYEGSLRLTGSLPAQPASGRPPGAHHRPTGGKILVLTEDLDVVEAVLQFHCSPGDSRP
jgi:hypothetical protein